MHALEAGDRDRFDLGKREATRKALYLFRSFRRFRPARKDAALFDDQPLTTRAYSGTYARYPQKVG